MNYLEEILRLLLENNIMLRYICKDIISRSQTQDTRDIINNVIGDQISEYLSMGNK